MESYPIPQQQPENAPPNVAERLKVSGPVSRIRSFARSVFARLHRPDGEFFVDGGQSAWVVEPLVDLESLASIKHDPEMLAWLANGGVEKTIRESRKDPRHLEMMQRVFGDSGVVIVSEAEDEPEKLKLSDRLGLSSKSFNSQGEWSPPGDRELLVESSECIDLPAISAEDTEKAQEFSARLLEAADPYDPARSESDKAAAVARIAAVLAEANREAVLRSQRSE